MIDFEVFDDRLNHRQILYKDNDFCCFVSYKYIKELGDRKYKELRKEFDI